MDRVAVFAHYDKDNIIDDYVVYYLKKLKEICKSVIFVSCVELSDFEKAKLDGISDRIIDEKHDEYDFGSYKRGFLSINNLFDYDELIFANDSCYGPFFSLENVFTTMEMEMRDYDFWGLTLNKFGFKRIKNFIWQCKKPHLQSYFLVFNKKVFTSNIFTDFIQSIKPEKNKKDVIMNYEIGISETLSASGFKYSSYINKFLNINNSAVIRWRELITECGMPLMKCSLARLSNWKFAIVEGYNDLIKDVCDYPVELIKKNVARTKLRSFQSGKFPVVLKRKIMYFITSLPPFFRKICRVTLARILPFLLD